MTPRILKLEEKRLIGLNMKMSLIENKTGFLWRQFAPRINKILNRTSENKISILEKAQNYSLLKETQLVVLQKWLEIAKAKHFYP